MAPLSPSIRLSLFYGAHFLAVGIMLPYWPLWLESRGLGPEAIGLVLATVFWVKLIANPALSALVDATRRSRTVLAALAALSVAVFLGYGLADSLPAFLLLSALAAVSFQTVLPIGEALTLSVSKARSLDYGRIRLWGSVTFILAAAGLGAGIDRYGPDIVWPALIACMLLLFAACLALPAAPPRPAARWSWRDALGLATRPWFLLFVASAGAVQAGHAVYYAFGTIIWRGMGFSDSAIGLLWTLGVVAEIGLFWIAARLGRLGSGTALLGLAVAGSILRWALTPLADTLATAAPLQLLHALTFGAAHLGAMRLLQAHAPERLATTAQALYTALVGGVLMGTAMAVVGGLYQEFDRQAYWAMSALSLLALCPLCALLIVRPSNDC